MPKDLVTTYKFSSRGYLITLDVSAANPLGLNPHFNISKGDSYLSINLSDLEEIVNQVKELQKEKR